MPRATRNSSPTLNAVRQALHRGPDADVVVLITVLRLLRKRVPVFLENTHGSI